VVPIGLPASRRGRGCSGAARAQGGGGETAHRSSLSRCACWTSIGSLQRAWRGARGSRGGLGECRGGGGVRRTRALCGGRCAGEACECSARGFCNCTMRAVRVARLLPSRCVVSFWMVGPGHLRGRGIFCNVRFKPDCVRWMLQCEVWVCRPYQYGAPRHLPHSSASVGPRSCSHRILVLQAPSRVRTCGGLTFSGCIRAVRA